MTEELNHKPSLHVYTVTASVTPPYYGCSDQMFTMHIHCTRECVHRGSVYLCVVFVAYMENSVTVCL